MLKIRFIKLTFTLTFVFFFGLLTIHSSRLMAAENTIDLEQVEEITQVEDATNIEAQLQLDDNRVLQYRDTPDIKTYANNSCNTNCTEQTIDYQIVCFYMKKDSQGCCEVTFDECS